MSRPTPDWAKSYDALRREDLTRKVEHYYEGLDTFVDEAMTRSPDRVMAVPPPVEEDTVTVHRDDLAWALDRIPKRSRRSASYLLLSKALEDAR